jgi:signal transduction histidine kinase
MSVGNLKQCISSSILLRLIFSFVSLFYSSSSSALTESPVLAHWDTLFYTFALSGVAFSAAIVIAYRAYPWLVYVLFSLLLVINVASMDGTLAYLIGVSDFVIWVVPFLLTSSISAYGFWMISVRLDISHDLARYKKHFLVLAAVSAFFPLSCYFWLGVIPLSLMWVPVNILFFAMVLGQVLPPMTWPSNDQRLSRVIRLFPLVVGLLVVGTYAVHFLSSGYSQLELNTFNRIAMLLFAGFSLAIVIWQAFVSSREKDDAERRAMEAAINEAELQVSLLQAEKNYEHALSSIAQHRSRLATVSHDLKQPISALRIAIDQMNRSRKGDDKLSQAVDYIASLAHSYIDEGLDEHANNDSDEVFDTDKTVVPTSMFAKTLLQMFGDDAEQRGISFKVICPENQVYVVPLPTLRAMSNLIGNALAHAKASRILMGFRRKGNKVIFQVHDNGCGMSESVLSEVLLPLRKGSASEGHGLGLGIVKELCDAHGMLFSINSSSGQGTSAYMAMECADNKFVEQ